MTEKQSNKLEQKVDAIFEKVIKIDNKITFLETTINERQKQYEDKHEAIEEHVCGNESRIKVVEDNLAKGVWLVVSTVILGVLSLIIKI